MEVPPAEQKFGKALAQADRLGTKCALILGDDEIASDQLTLKSLADGTQTKVEEAKVLEFLKEKRA